MSQAILAYSNEATTQQVHIDFDAGATGGM
jgi:hypothetical protein